MKITKSKLDKIWKKWDDIEDGEVFRDNDETVWLAIDSDRAVSLDGNYVLEDCFDIDVEFEMLEAEIIIKE